MLIKDKDTTALRDQGVNTARGLSDGRDYFSARGKPQISTIFFDTLSD